MAFDSSAIRDFFETQWQAVFTELGISHNNITKGFAFRDITNQNLPSVEIITTTGNGSFAGNAREPLTNITTGAVKRIWQRTANIQMRVTANPIGNGNANYLERLTSLFYRRLTTQQFDVGTDSSPVSADTDQMRVAVMDNFSENYTIHTTEGKPATEECVLSVAVSYYEYQVNS